MSITFKRPLSPYIESVFTNAASLNSRVYNVEIAVEIVLADATELDYATKQLIMDTLSQDGASISITPVTFVGRLSGVPEFRHSQSKAPDGGELDIVNLDYIISSAAASSTRPFDGATITVYLCFPKTGGTYEGLVYFAGLIRDAGGDNETGKLTLISDLSYKGALLGREITQRCLNVLGDDWCGVPSATLPPGATCTNVWHDREGGCLYWGGVFKGVPFINPNALLLGSVGGVSGDGGWGGGCPDVKTSVFPSANGGHIKGSDLVAGEAIDSPCGHPVIVLEVEHIWADYRYRVSTHLGAGLIVSATHRFLTHIDDPRGHSAVEWNMRKNGLLQKINGDHNIANPVRGRVRQEYRFRVAASGTVLKLSVSKPETYWAGMDPGKYIGSHNNKHLNDALFNPIYSVS